jgi:peroxiredoxin
VRLSELTLSRRQFAVRVAAVFPAAAVLNAHGFTKAEGQELIGKPAPPLALKDWLNSNPLEMGDLRGKVVLLRWWTEGCPYCVATAPALVSLERTNESRGLQVIGVFHPKPPGKWTMDALRRAAQEKHFTFPIAVDGDWTALNRWWLTKDRDFTSVSFLVDRSGIIRYVHAGGEFRERQQGGTPVHEACNRDMHFIQREISKLLNT